MNSECEVEFVEKNCVVEKRKRVDTGYPNHSSWNRWCQGRTGTSPMK